MVSDGNKGGRGYGSWSASWMEARSCLLHVAHPVSRDRWQQYWDLRSAGYMEQLAGDDTLRESILSFMTREGLVATGDEVLDIGCGPGPYTIPLAAVLTVAGFTETFQEMYTFYI